MNLTRLGLAIAALACASNGPPALADEPKAGPTTAAEPQKPRYRILERKRLADHDRKKLERERAERLKSAEKFLAEKAKEYSGVPWGQRHKIRTSNFEVHCNSTRRVAEAYGALMEIIRAKLAEMFPSRVFRHQRAAVFIYCSQEEFMNHDGMGRWAGRGLGGYYNPISQSVTTYHGTFGFTGTTFSVLCHEGTHYYQGLVLKDFDNVPIWLIEGLAVYFGDGSNFDPRTRKIEIGKIPRDRLAHIQEKMLKQRHTPIDKLVAMTRSSGFYGTHYADSWALIYYLVNSGDKGKKLLTAYWSAGLERLLKKQDFLDLAERYFGGVQSLQKEYEKYVLALEMPPAGKVLGDYFVSDSFQFDFKAPGDDWFFFEDPADRKLLVGAFLPGTSAEIRIYYDNNLENAAAETYLKLFQKANGQRWQDVKEEKAKVGNHDGFKLTYVETAAPAMERDGPEDEDIAKGAEKAKEKAAAAPSKDAGEPREVVHFLLVQVDGVVSIRCSAKKREAANYAELFHKANERFTLSLTRRW